MARPAPAARKSMSSWSTTVLLVAKVLFTMPSKPNLGCPRQSRHYSIWLPKYSAAVRPSPFADLPEAVLAYDPAVVAECPEIAATDVDPFTVDRRPADGPLGHSATSAGEMVPVLVAD